MKTGLARLRGGEWISSVSAILLFVLMFFHWFDVEYVNNTGLLFLIESTEPGKNAWEALDYIPIVLGITVVTTLAGAVLRACGFSGPFLRINMLVAALGFIAMLLILFRIINPPDFGAVPLLGMREGAVTSEGVVKIPIFLALLPAAGIAFGGWLAVREESSAGMAP